MERQSVGNDEDDLGNFLNEIEEIEKSVPYEEDRQENKDKIIKDKRNINEEMKIAPPIEIVSKPQIIAKDPERPRTVYVAYSGTYTGPASAAKVKLVVCRVTYMIGK